jgi:hypothetical protein
MVKIGLDSKTELVIYKELFQIGITVFFLLMSKQAESQVHKKREDSVANITIASPQKEVNYNGQDSLYSFKTEEIKTRVLDTVDVHLKSIFDNFFNNHIQLNRSGTYVYCQESFHDWSAVHECTPKYFKFNYWITVSDDLKFSLLNLYVDSLMNFRSYPPKMSKINIVNDQFAISKKVIDEIAISNKFELDKMIVHMELKRNNFVISIRQVISRNRKGVLYHTLKINPWDASFSSKKRERVKYEGSNPTNLNF